MIHLQSRRLLSGILHLIIALVLIISFPAPLHAERATLDEMEQVCLNWLALMGNQPEGWAGEEHPVIVGVDPLMDGDSLLAFSFTIHPEGHVVVPVLMELPPVKSYSMEYALDVQQTVGYPQLLREVLQHRMDLFGKTYGSLDATQPPSGEILFHRKNRMEWDRYLADTATFQQWLKNGESSPMPGVGPLLTCSWHQSYPYDLDCPYGDGGRCIVGCVATAAAQIMHYHQWPTNGTGSNSYYWDGDDSCGGWTNGGYLNATFSDAYDWANMPDNCNSGCDAAERNALAELCYEVGVAFEMDYGYCGSGAYTADALSVFPAYFKYDSSIDQEYRYNHSSGSWFSTIQAEINNSRPILYRIYGHAIVCDGWRTSGGQNQYHINYGWGGSYTAWYTIDHIYGSDPVNEEYLIRRIIPLGGNDTTPPNTTITAGCADTITVPHIAFFFTGSDDTDPSGSLVYSHHLDSEPWTNFGGLTQATFTGLGDGQHIFRVRARDLSGNVDPTPAMCLFTVDTGGGQGFGPAECIVTGPGPGPDNPPLVCVYDPACPAVLLSDWLAYGVEKHGVNVATGDIDGDEFDEIVTGPGPGEVFGPHVRAFERAGSAISRVNFFAYGTSKYGVNVACGDIDGDSIDEIITGAGPGAVFGPHVRAWNVGAGSTTPISQVSYFAYGTPKWGVNVACGDIDGDGIDEIITGAGPGAVYGPHVRGWNYDGSVVTPISGVSYFAYGTLKYGVNVACGDVDGDGMDEIITGAGPGEVFGAHVRGWNYDGSSLSAMPQISYFAYTDNYRYGVRVGTGDLDNDNRDEILTAPGPRSNQYTLVRAWNNDGGGSTTMIDSIDFLAYDDTIKYGGSVAAGDFDGNHTDGMTRR